MNGQLIVPPTKNSYLSTQSSESLEQVIEQDLYWSKNLPPVDLEIHGNTTNLNNSHEGVIEINKTFVNAVQDIIDTYCKPCDTVTAATVEAYLLQYLQQDISPNVVCVFFSAIIVSLVRKKNPTTKALTKAKAIARSLLLRASLDVDAYSKQFVTAIALGLQHATLFKSDIVVPMLAEQISKSRRFKSGELIVLQHVFKPFANNLKHLAKLVPKKVARILVQKFSDFLQDESVDIDTKQIALDLLSELSSIAGDEHAPKVVAAITNLLENTESEVVQEKCQDQLKMTFSSKGREHPMVQNVIKLVEKFIGSPNFKDRKKAVILFSSYISETTLVDAITKTCIFLADPEREIRQYMIKELIIDAPALIQNPAYEMLLMMLKEVLNEENDDDDALRQKKELRHLKSGKSIAEKPEAGKNISLNPRHGTSQDDRANARKQPKKKNMIKRKHYTIPLEVLDPMNASFLTSDEYIDLRSWYGMKQLIFKYKSDDDADEEENDDELFNQLQISATSTAEAAKKVSKANAPAHSTSENRKEKRKLKKRADKIAAKTCDMDLIPLIRRVMSRDVDKGKKLLLLAEKNLSNLESFLEKYEIDSEEQDTETPKFMEAIKHLLNVDIALLRAHVRPEVTSLIKRYEMSLDAVMHHCQVLRDRIATDLQEQSFSEWDTRSVAITSLPMWNTFQRIRNQAKASTTDASIYTSFRKDYEKREKRMTKNNQMLFRLTSFLTTIILRFSRIYSSKDSNIKPEDGFAGVLWLEKTLMTITHRGLRGTLRQAITEAMDVGSDFFGPEKCESLATDIGKNILSSASSDLRKRLCDVAFITGCVMPNITDTKTRQNLVKGLIKLWSHSDGEVASEAIAAILRLGKLNVAEVTDIVKAKRGSSRIMTYITKVKSNLGNYPDIRVRNGLDELQNWAQLYNIKIRV